MFHMAICLYCYS